MPQWLTGQGFAFTFAVLFGIVLLRAQATYWAGRGVAGGVRRTSLGRRMDSAKAGRAISALNRWGLPVVTISFVTVGFQTAVNAAAGFTRMRWTRYTAAMLPGCVVWAFVYATVGFGAFTAWMNLHGAWRWVAITLVALVIAGGVAIVWHVRVMRRRALAAPAPIGADPAGPSPC